MVSGDCCVIFDMEKKSEIRSLSIFDPTPHIIHVYNIFACMRIGINNLQCIKVIPQMIYVMCVCK